MTWFDIAIICPVIFGIYYIQQIKIALKTRGFYVEMFGGWLADYRRFKEMIAAEEDEEAKVRYMSMINGLHLSLIFLAVVVLMRVMGKL